MPDLVNETSSPERRRWTRVAIGTQARLSCNGAAWEGTALNMSLGGVFMTFAGGISATENQAIQLGLQTDAGMLEIRGTVRSLREFAPRRSTTDDPALGLAVEFETLDALRERVFLSILHALREQSVPVKLVGLLIPLETGDLLLEISASGIEPVRPAEESPANPPADEECASGSSPIISEQLEHRNPAGRRIATYHDALAELAPQAPLVVIAPGFGDTKKEHVPLAYYFARNGFHVLRYDHTNHVGESDGDIVEATLSGMDEDLGTVLDYAGRTWPDSPIVVIAASLSGRIALKRVARVRGVGLLVLLTSVVDLQGTLNAVHQEDHMISFLRGAKLGVMNVLGFNVNADRFLSDAIKSGYATLASTLQDARRIRTPVIFFAAEHDAWVDLESVKVVQQALGAHAAHLYLIPEALHRLHENPRKARAVFRQLVACCLERLSCEAREPAILEPSKREIGLQSRLERERARARHHMAKNEMVEFWRDYLDNFHYIANVSDYWHLLDHIYRLTGDIEGGMRILDAGCGNGNFGMFLLINQAYRQRNNAMTGTAPLHYTGMDLIQPALAKARRNIRETTAQVRGKFSADAAAPSASMNASLLAADLNLPLPFRDCQFDRVICNLVIGYLQDPLSLLKEFVRVLSSSGRLIITNLKPHPDLSQIYRNFVRRMERPEELEEAKHLLNNSGKIIQAESNGVFRFFDRQELAALLIESGAARPRVYSTFANQAYIAAAEKAVAMREDRPVSAAASRMPRDPAIQA